MKELLLLTWQFPQNILGLCLLCVFKTAGKLVAYQHHHDVYRVSLNGFGVSLSPYIFVGNVADTEKTIQHEKGHAVQSRRYGPLYLLIVGIPSLVRNIIHRTLHKSWTYEERQSWYYSGWPEKQADKLGGVVRD
jgi:hypothetical protein